MKKLIHPTKDEDIAITKAIEKDPDTWIVGDFSKTKPGRPFSGNPKLPISIRLDPPIVEYFKSGGKGWQSRINKVLAEHVEKITG